MNSAALGGAYAVYELGPVLGGLVVGGALYVGYKVVRWTAGEVAYFATKARQIQGGSRAAELGPLDLAPGVHVPGETVTRRNSD
ncbi:hypothetical protein [Streptomyces sp. NPDC057375]|uniref:hypothetical protein n=1 Tax=Streptomyces sp. NPDC057375 TaxID=3346109 RepID=UPI003639B1C7